MILHLNNEVNLEMLDRLADCYNSIHPEETLDIYFASVGGDIAVVYAMLDIIDKHKHRTRLFGYSHLFSSGFKFFFQANCEKKLLPHVDGMYHLSRVHGVGFTEGAVIHNVEYENFLKKKLKTFPTLEDTAKYVDFTEEELERIKNNYDEYFTHTRLEKMLKFNKKYLGL